MITVEGITTVLPCLFSSRDFTINPAGTGRDIIGQLAGVGKGRFLCRGPPPCVDVRVFVTVDISMVVRKRTTPSVSTCRRVVIFCKSSWAPNEEQEPWELSSILLTA